MNEFDMYLNGMSIPEINKKLGIALSTLFFRFKKKGILRSRKESLILAGKQGKLGSGNRGKKIIFTDEHKQKIKESALMRWKGNAKKISLKPNGYLEFTTGKYKGKLVHRVIMESYLGRCLDIYEEVHHCDNIKTHNKIYNLELMVKSEHAKLHRILNPQLKDNINGQFKRRYNGKS
jgi:HNH endonuclease